MQPRDRQQMGKAGIPHRLQRRLLDGAAVAGEQRRREGSGRRFGACEDSGRDPVTYPRQQREPAAPFPLRGCDRLRRPVAEADGADALEPGLTREVPRTRFRRRRRRPQRGQRREPAPGRGHAVGAAAPHAEPHPHRGLLRRQAFDVHAVEEVALRPLAGADPNHAPGYVDGAEGPGEHRRPHPLGAPVGSGDAGGEQRQRRQGEGRRCVPAQQQRDGREEPGRARRGPAHRLDGQRQIEAAARAEENRHPEEEALALRRPKRAEISAKAGRRAQHRGPVPWRSGRLPPGDMLNARSFRPMANASAFRRG